ncbi:MAG: hypothetical protein JWO69_225 [Thermoleophilia bacterium]|jgi:hypothetical protein|nr:hypothetical protein [Thermoleophilia bacterium]
MPRSPRRRTSTFRLLRALWRYRGRIEAHGRRYNVELATALRTLVETNAPMRAGVRLYRLAMRVLLVLAIGLGLVALATTVLLWREDARLALLALLPAALAGLLGWWRFAWGAPLDWYSEYADTTRTIPAREVPRILGELATELRGVANVPANVSRDLDDLATRAASDLRVDGPVTRHD